MSLDFLRAVALTGGDWVIWGLLAASVVAAAVIVERTMLLSKEMKSLDSLQDGLRGRLDAGEEDAVAEAVRAHAGAAGRILEAALSGMKKGRAAAEDRIQAAALEEKRWLERRLLILGTLGNNAPFVGLFGTVLGVMRAFHDLSTHAGAGPEVVMKGLSEALLATAVGLFVAIPCVIGYNYLHKRVQDLLSSTESLSRMLLTRI